jgi:ceramide glucosyltransferase
MWSLLAVIASRAAMWAWVALGITLVLRFAVAMVVGGSVLEDRKGLKALWLLPLRDLAAVAIWIASLGGHTVTWRGDRFRLKRGKLTRVAS